MEHDLQITVGLELTGGFMLNKQKMKFTDAADETCNFCTEQDSHHHRILACPATQHIRDCYPRVTEQLTDNADLPNMFLVMYQPPEYDTIHTLLYRLPEPEVGTLEAQAMTFTDGSCIHPGSVAHRLASYAIVYPVVEAAELYHHRHAPIAWLVSTTLLRSCSGGAGHRQADDKQSRVDGSGSGI